MRLYYFESQSGNFGDDLNPWLWNQLIPELLDVQDDTLFVGIGTLLNHRIPTGFKKVVFGSGAGYGDRPLIDDSWNFQCVRGPLTAKALGLDPSLAVTDSAALVSTLPLPKPSRDSGIAFMPHVSSAINADWEQICKIVDIRYIDPRWNVDRILQEISCTEILVTEAMHGAIIADTLRVPWVPVVCYDYILEFKWLDWSASLGLDYSPDFLPGVWDVERDSTLSVRLKNQLKRGLISLGAPGKNLTQPPNPKSQKKDFDKLANEFASLLNRLSSRLSEQSRFDEAVQRLQEKLENVKIICNNSRSFGFYK